MERQTFNNLLIAYTERRPFVPFTVVLTDGERFEIDHRSAVAFRDGSAVFYAPGTVPHFFDYQNVVQLIGDLAGNAAG